MRSALPPATLLCAVLLMSCSGQESVAPTPSPAQSQGESSPSSDEETADQAPTDAPGPTPVQFRVVRASGNSDSSTTIPEELRDEFEALDCAAAPPLAQVPADEGQVSCGGEQVRYILEPASLESAVESAEVAADESGNPLLTVSLESADAADLSRVTSDLADTGTRLAVVVDGFVVTAPIVVAPIEGGVLQIAGDFSEVEADELVRRLTVG